MVPAGVEPATLALLAPRSNRLSYETFHPRYRQSSQNHLQLWTNLESTNLNACFDGNEDSESLDLKGLITLSAAQFGSFVFFALFYKAAKDLPRVRRMHLPALVCKGDFRMPQNAVDVAPWLAHLDGVRDFAYVINRSYHDIFTKLIESLMMVAISVH